MIPFSHINVSELFDEPTPDLMIPMLDLETQDSKIEFELETAKLREYTHAQQVLASHQPDKNTLVMMSGLPAFQELMVELGPRMVGCTIEQQWEIANEGLISSISTGIKKVIAWIVAKLKEIYNKLTNKVKSDVREKTVQRIKIDESSVSINTMFPVVIADIDKLIQFNLDLNEFIRFYMKGIEEIDKDTLADQFNFRLSSKFKHGVIRNNKIFFRAFGWAIGFPYGERDTVSHVNVISQTNSYKTVDEAIKFPLYIDGEFLITDKKYWRVTFNMLGLDQNNVYDYVKKLDDCQKETLALAKDMYKRIDTFPNTIQLDEDVDATQRAATHIPQYLSSLFSFVSTSELLTRAACNMFDAIIAQFDNPANKK